MADNTIGGALVIPASLLKDLQETDKRIEKIGQSSGVTAAAFMSNFQRMTTSVKDLNEALKLTVQHLGDLGGKMKAADLAGLSQAARDANQLSTGITKAAENVERLNASTKQTAQTSKEASVTFAEAMAAYGNYNSIKEATEALKKLKAARDSMQMRNDAGANDDYAANLAALNNAIATLSKRVKDLQKDEATLAREQEKAAQAADREALAQQRLNERLESQRARQAAQAAYERNTTYQGSLSYAESASTINQRTQAIRYLTVARNELSTTDADYTQKLAALNAKIREMNAANKEAIAGSKELNTHHRSLINTADQLKRSLALVFSVSQIRGYISEMVKVRGEFELQQRSLEAILQDKPVADEIFNKTVQLAVQSPFTIKELVSYTKQLAAFRIESDKLYDTTKRLSDVSAGLGVSMDRIILAYGQVKAAAYLRGQEVRQFTEAGINLYAELQRYYEDVRGEAYTTGQIVDMISRRMVTFEDVDAVFQRLTNEGGIFYRMQEIQAETLRGRLANLQDSFDLMLNSIGQSNEGMLKGGIDLLRTFLEHWETVAEVLKGVAAAFVLLRLQAARTGLAMNAVLTGEVWAATKNNIKTLFTLQGAVSSLGTTFKVALTPALNLLKSLIATLASNAILIGVAAIGIALKALWDHYKSMREESERLVDAFYDNMAPVNKLAAEYNKLAQAAQKAATAQGASIDIEENTDERRKLLRELARQFSDEFKVDIDVSAIANADLDKSFAQYSDQFERMQRDAMLVGEAFNECGRDAIKAGKNVKAAETDLIKQSYAIEQWRNSVGAHYDTLTEQARTYYDTIAEGKRPNETDVDYYLRAYQALARINELVSDPTLKNAGDYFIKAIGFDADGLKKAKLQLDHALDDVVKQVDMYGVQNPAVIRTALDDLGAEKELDEFTVRLMQRRFNVELNLDTKEAEEKIETIAEQLRRNFDNKTYTFNYKLNGKEYAEGLKDVEDVGDKTLKEFKSIDTRLRHARLATAEADGKDILALEADYQAKRSELISMGFVDEVNQIEGRGRKANKAERDIWNERINILKEMNSEYNKLRKTMSVADAQKTVADEYRNAAEYVRMQDVLDISTWFANDENTANMIDKLKGMVAKATSRLSAEKDVAKLRIGIDEEAFNKELDRIKKSVDEAFAGLDLTQRLTGAGLHEYQVQMIFPDVAMSFEQVQKRIRDEYKVTDEMLEMTEEKMKEVMSEKQYEGYNDAMKKLNDDRLKQQRSTIEQMVKDYKNVLDEQVKLDLWYAKERAKIYDDAYNLDPAMQQEMTRNLDRQYNQRSQKIMWDDFTDSGFYTLMFSQIEYASKTSLELMRKKLGEIKDAMGDLDPENLKQIADLEQKLDERTVKIAPWQTLTATFKDMVTFLRERKQLEQDLAESTDRERELETLQREQALNIQELEIEADQLAMKGELTAEEQERWDVLKETLANEKADLGQINKEYDQQKANTQKITDTLKKGQQTQDQFSGSASELVARYRDILETIQAMVDNWDQIFGSASGWMHDFLDVTMECANASLTIASGIESISKGDTFSGIATALQGTISLVASLFSIKDRRLEREIKKLQKETDNLAKSYERLSDAMADAWDITRLQTYRNEMEKTIKAEIANYEEMIRLEEEKKKTDNDKIEEYRENIEELYDQLDELADNFYEALGGFGSQANYKSAAEEFADAWMDAFKEGSDTLEALNDEFNDLFANLLTKQISTRLAEAYLQPIMDAMDNALVDANGNARDLDTTMSMLASAWAGIDAAAEGYNEAANQIMELLKSYGLDLTEGAATSELSALQQGIEGVTEQTASALESILNSMRFYLATQQGDVREIRDYLLAGQVETNSTESPMLLELQSQTSILREMRDMWNRVTKATTNGYMLRVAGIS